MIERHLMKLQARDDVDASEERAIRAAISEVREYPAHTALVRAGEALGESLLLLDGVLCRQKDLATGERQITELHLAGDFADLHGFTLKRLDHDLMTLTPSRIAVVPHPALLAITERHPHLTRLYWLTTNIDAAIHREWALSLGRRSAISRMANLFCELQVRFEVVGLSEGGRYGLDLTQAELAEVLGITAVHVNRTLMQLRAQGLVEFRDGEVTIGDQRALRDLAEFDPSYLYVEKRPR
jgi:CRP-like cAMP-binding protein